MNHFVNWSNHPSSSWSDEQYAAASALGEVVDIPFPNIPPDFDIRVIDSLARRGVESISAAYPDRKGTVIHVQGEMTFLYRALLLLEKEGYRAVASTSERQVSFTPDGEKVVRFDFSGFRDYFLGKV